MLRIRAVTTPLAERLAPLARLLVSLASPFVLLASPLACGKIRPPQGGIACATDSCADPDPDRFACKAVLDASGRAFVPDFLDELNDPFANIVLKRPGACPDSYAETIEKLRLEDTARCIGSKTAGMTVRGISERGLLLARPEPMRMVVTRQCSSRAEESLLFAVPTIDPLNPELPTSFQAVAWDSGALAYNFYSLDENDGMPTWSFHGNSFDFIDRARDEPDERASCAQCHSDGGLIMRELSSPWLHWESGPTKVAGMQLTIDRFPALGSRSTAPGLERVIRSGNQRWNESRIAGTADREQTAHHDGTVAELLRPLFCPTSFNLGSAGVEPRGFAAQVERIPQQFFVDPAFAQPVSTQPSGVTIDPTIYRQTLVEIGASIDELIGPSDTHYGFTFVARAGSDTDYVDRLIRSAFVDEEFVLDVLSIDPTRPVFSPQRCALLAYAPTFAEIDEAPKPTIEPPQQTTSCCEVHPSSGCATPEVQACVCTLDNYCCDNTWDQRCVNYVESGCGQCLSKLEADPGLGISPPSTAAPFAPSDLRNAFIAKLSQQQGDPAAAQLHRELTTGGQLKLHRERLQDFITVCQDRASRRDPAGFVLDLMKVATARLDAAKRFSPVLDTPGAVASNDLNVEAGLRLNLLTCELELDDE